MGLNIKQWGTQNPDVSGSMALDPTWGGGLRGSGMGAEVTQGQAAEKKVRRPPPHGRNRQNRAEILKFPSNLGTEPTQQNYMQFTFKEIAASSEGKGGTRGADPRNLVFKAAYGWPTVCLPIPSGLNTSYQQNWDVAQTAGRHAMLAEQGAQAIRAAGQWVARRGAGDRQDVASLAARIASDTNQATASLDEGESWGSRAGRFIGNTASELSGMALTSNIGELGDIARAGQYSAGLRMIDQAMLSYGGPGFRSFQYNFSFKPNSWQESVSVHYMVQAFKEFSAPNQRATKYTRVYDLPGVFKIQFYYGLREHRTIGRIGHCALTNIAVRYGGEKFTTFSEGHMPVQWDVTLDFKELELLNREAIKTENSHIDSSNWPNYEPHHPDANKDWQLATITT